MNDDLSAIGRSADRMQRLLALDPPDQVIWQEIEIMRRAMFRWEKTLPAEAVERWKAQQEVDATARLPRH